MVEGPPPAEARVAEGERLHDVLEVLLANGLLEAGLELVGDGQVAAVREVVAVAGEGRPGPCLGPEEAAPCRGPGSPDERGQAPSASVATPGPSRS